MQQDLFLKNITMIKHIRIENLRSLKDTGFVELRPLTILLGANSSGKSTFLRSFPLFTQSVNKKLRGALSWFDDSLVDFGDYDIAINNQAKKNGEKICFSYKLSSIKEDCDKFPIYYRHLDIFRRERYRNDYYSIPNELTIRITYDNDSNGTYVQNLQIEHKDCICEILSEKRESSLQFIVNGEKFELGKTAFWRYSTYHAVLPDVEVKSKDENFSIYSTILNNIGSFVKERADKRLKKIDKIITIIKNYKFDNQEFLNYLKTKCAIDSLEKYVLRHNWDVHTPEFVTFCNNLILMQMLDFIPIINAQLVTFYEKCSYIAPTRAEASRYYRTQGLQVDDIDPYGKNLQEFIASLNTSQLKSYKEYTQNLLGIQVVTKSEAGHKSIKLVSSNGEFNIADVGFGYSQILPIVTKLWYIDNKRNVDKRNGYTLIYYQYFRELFALMEQPELHLHPAYQAKIADAFIKVIKNNEDVRVRLLIETHSETIINRIGRRIREGMISSNDVMIVIFNKAVEHSNTSITTHTFNEKGQLENWPIGFFDPED